jgi:hypothetical protein
MESNLERKAWRGLMLRKGLEVLGWVGALVIFALATDAVLAAPARESVGDARRAQSRQVAPERQRRAPRALAEEEEEASPASIVRAARTLYVRPDVRVDKKYLEYKLQKYTELRDWGLMIVEDERAADLVLKVDQKALNYIFSITDPATSIVVVSGKVVAINDLVAAEYLGKEIVKKIRDVRASAVPQRSAASKKRDRADAEEEEEGP